MSNFHIWFEVLKKTNVFVCYLCRSATNSKANVVRYDVPCRNSALLFARTFATALRNGGL